MGTERGHLVLFLHAHLPFVRHPEHPDFLEEDWLYEAITETYIPLVGIMERWLADAVPARLTMSVTPPLMEMLRDELLMSRYAERLSRLVDLAAHEVVRNAGDERFAHTARMYRDRFVATAQRFERDYGRDLLAQLARLQEAGVLEVVTSTATHAFLPHFAIDPAFARAQIHLGVEAYRHHFHRNPPGIWLAECGFVPGVDRLLADEGLTYFLVDSHGVQHADPPPVYGTYSPLMCPSGVLAFPRDPESSRQVWSGEIGYPGDPRYREFYRDLGWDSDDEAALAAFRLPGGGKKNTGLKYHRITGRSTALHDKEPYHRGWAMEAADEHAANFVHNRQAQISHWQGALRRPPVVVAPYDAELFGHWWFEGPEFLDLVVRKAAFDQQAFRLSTPSDVMKGGLEIQVSTPAPSSWGAKGYGEVWLNDKNDWVWSHVHHAAEQMARVAAERPNASGVEARALNQLARELVLASASDWPFIMTMGTMVAYAERRVREHINRFNWLLDAIESGRVDPEWLSKLEKKDSIFSFIDYRSFAR